MKRRHSRPRKPKIKSVSPTVSKPAKRKTKAPIRRIDPHPPVIPAFRHDTGASADPLAAPLAASSDHTANHAADSRTTETAAGHAGMYDVFRFPVIDWDFRWQRPQQMSVQFARHGHRVFYATTTMSVLPKEDAAFDEVARYVKVKLVKPNVWLVTLCANRNLNLYTDQMSATDIRYLNWSIEYIRERFQIGHLVSIVDLPFWTPLVSSMEDSKLLYDCMDEHNGFSTNAPSMIRLEEQLARKADLVLASSQRLHDRMKSYHSSPLLLRNAADAAHFAAHAPVAPELASIQGPVIGYYGAISDWFDAKLVERMAERRPEWTFALIGHTFGCDTAGLEKLPNVLLLGEKRYHELPMYLHRFDAAIIPFLQNELTKATNPVKLYEYLAAGKPVVSTALPELETVAAGLTVIARTPEAFEQAVERSLRQNNPQLAEARKNFAASHTWETRYEELHRTILKRLFPKVSIVMLAHNNWPYTRQCLFSLQKPGRYPHLEVIIIDNGSTDETSQRLAELDPDCFKIIRSDVNLGFAAGNSLGCRKAAGEYIILLNNDTIVPDGSWIRRLIRPLEKHPGIGMSGPMSNHVGNDQAVDLFVGNPVEGANPHWLKEFYGLYKGRSRYTDLLGFFCVAMRRSVFEEVGGLDSKYGIGMFEDDDYCEQVRRAGYKLLIVEDAFVYHHGSATIKKLKQEQYDDLWRSNKAYYERKWNKPWRQPKRPENIFYGADTPEGVAGKLGGRPCLLVLGGREWSRTPARWQQMVRELSQRNDCIIVVYLSAYFGHEVVGIRKAGPRLYVTNRPDLFSHADLESVVYCGGTDVLPYFSSDRCVVDTFSYHAHQLDDLKIKLQTPRVLETEDVPLLISQLRRAPQP